MLPEHLPTWTVPTVNQADSEIMTEPKRKPRQDDSDREKRERKQQEEALDEALEDTFPASDPVAAEEP